MDLKMGPFFGLTKGIFIKVRKTDPFLGPFSGPENCPVFWPRFFDFRVRWDPVLDGGGGPILEFRGGQSGTHPPRPEGPDQRPILEHFAGAIQVCWRSLRVAPFLDIWLVMRRVARILLAFQAFFICVDLMLATTICGPMFTIFATLKENEEQLCVTRLVAWKSSPKNGLIFGSENWSRKSLF